MTLSWDSLLDYERMVKDAVENVAKIQRDEQTAITVYDGMAPTPTENQAKMREYFELLMKRGAVSMIITAELANGDAATSAVGPPAGLESLARLAVLQIRDMLSRKTGENG